CPQLHRPAATGSAAKVSHLHSNHCASRRTHDLRHTFISMCLQNGIPEHTVAAWVGDSVDELRRTYSHLLKDHADTHGAVAAGLTARPKLSVVRAA
ncbi:hypothetical protein ACFXB5_48950, partial [Streptomyces sp. NPDC059455]